MKNYNWLTQNSKLKKISGLKTFNWGIPAVKTCPQAGVCKLGCYADMGAYKFSNVAAVFQKRLDLTKTPEFVNTINAEITRRKIKRVRIHDSGDFYSAEYIEKWIQIMKLHPTVEFYAYTKMVEMFKELDRINYIPNNFTYILSYGGRQDHMIDPTKDRHSIVFETKEQLNGLGYIDASKDDAQALQGNSRVGLVYHGTKNFANTEWNPVLASFLQKL